MRTATCACGKLKVEASGEPVRNSICHCNACKKRTGSAFSAQARFLKTDVTISGASRVFVRAGESGNRSELHFCPECGSTVYWFPEAAPDIVYVATGAFADPSFPRPEISVYDECALDWVKPLAAAIGKHE